MIWWHLVRIGGRASERELHLSLICFQCAFDWCCGRVLRPASQPPDTLSLSPHLRFGLYLRSLYHWSLKTKEKTKKKYPSVLSLVSNDSVNLFLYFKIEMLKDIKILKRLWIWTAVSRKMDLEFITIFSIFLSVRIRFEGN